MFPMHMDPDEVLLLNFLLEDKAPGAVPVAQFLGRALRALRTHLRTETAFISQFRDGVRVISHVDPPGDNSGVYIGRRDPLGETACQRVADGRLPELIHDTAAMTGADELPAGFAAHVGAHLCVPIRLDDGSVYGALTCVSRSSDPSLNARDVRLTRVFAEMMAEHIEADMKAVARAMELFAKIKTVIAERAVSFLYQPVLDTDHAAIIGFEALARFPGMRARSPDSWFADASRIGLDVELETSIVAKAFEGFTKLPAAIYVGFNVSPHMVVSGELDAAFKGLPLERIVLEVNEHMSFRQYDELARALKPMRDQGLRVCVNDAGAGLDGFTHIVNLRPDLIKLDMNIVREIDTDPARRALAAALIHFGREQRCTVIAEGVETAAQFSALKALGVSNMQGFFLGRPATLASAVALIDGKRKIFYSETKA
jgi:EAL domain-containing protein (putative c-di-GMP-specific phosphodiesterase class I)